MMPVPMASLAIAAVRTLIVALVIAVLTISADAQSDRSLTNSEGSHRYENLYDSQKEVQKVRHKHRKKGDEKKYEDALEKIPDSYETFDPWKSAR
jgi:hypothetical protein